MKKTHRAVLKFLAEGGKDFRSVHTYLHIVFPDMKMGLNYYNVTLLLKKLQVMGYIYFRHGESMDLYHLTEKGREYVSKMKEGGLNYDS